MKTFKIILAILFIAYTLAGVAMFLKRGDVPNHFATQWLVLMGALYLGQLIENKR